MQTAPKFLTPEELAFDRAIDAENQRVDDACWTPDREAEAQAEFDRERALCDADTFSDWLCGECCGHAAYASNHRAPFIAASHDADALKIDYDNARNMGAPELLALALGMTPNSEARIAAMDEIGRRYLEHLRQKERQSIGAGRAALKAFGFPEVRA